MSERIQKLLDTATTALPSGFVIWDEYAIEAETALFLFSLIRHQKPDLVVESGTGRGISSTFIAEALAANGKGKLVTFEWFDFFREGAERELAGLPVEVREGLSAESGLDPDVVFIDCVSDKRAEEITHWLTHPKRPLVIIHDARRNEYPFHLGDGVHLPGHDGVWIGRAKE
jgi:predicted O-methyltransferase YrrM